jgi:hypothetical protein
MIRRILKNTIYLLLFLMPAQAIWAQSGVKVKATVDRNKILIGEHFTLYLEADIPETEAIRFFDLDTLPHFEFLEKQKIDTSNTSEGTVLKQEIRMTSFDSGRWVIPAMMLDQGIATDSIVMEVVFSSPFDPNQPYHDIKDVLDVEVEEKEDWWWYAAGGGLLLLLLILWLVLRKKPVKVKPPPPPVNAYEEAMNDLARLQKEKTAPKIYYSSLVDIFRLYIARKKGISSLQKTTDDLVVQLKSLSIPHQDFDPMAQALRLSDYVKFAKYVPAAEDDRGSIIAIKNAIEAIEKLN